MGNIFLNNIFSIISGIAINNNIFEVFESLAGYGFDTTAYRTFGIKRYGD